MSKIELPAVTGNNNTSRINDNFKKIEDALNQEVLYRNGYVGEPNEMETNLDMNGKEILNVATGTSDGSLVTKSYVDQGLSLKFDKSGGPLSGPVDMQNNQINNLPNATQPSQPATYAQLLQVESAGDPLLRSELYAPGGAGLIGFQQAGTGAAPRTVESKLGESVSVKDFGAKGDGIADDTNALNEFWAYIKTDLISLYPVSLPFATKNYVIPPGVYRVTSSVNWTALQAWNVQIEANGAVIVGEVNGKSIVDSIGCRGVHIQGLGVIGHPSFTPKSGILIGPVGTNTCGNNKFSDVKIFGNFSISAMHNIGSETTRHDMCYYMNQRGFSMAGDGLHKLGAVSDYQAIRAPGVAVSFTNNAFASCRFENGDKTSTYLDSVYMEATRGWAFDSGCYFLAFDGAGIRIVDATGVYRTSNLKVDGLFETNQAPGLKYVIRVVVGSETQSSAILTSSFTMATPHANVAAIRVETAAGGSLTTGLFSFLDCELKVDNAEYGMTKLFDGSRIAFTGHITCRSSSIINVKDLLRGYGTITTDSPPSIPSTVGNTQLAFTCYGGEVLSGQGVQHMLGGGSEIAFQGGTHPSVRATGAAADVDLRLLGKGAGLVRFGAVTTNADAPVTGYITIKDSSGTTRKLAVIS